MTRRQRRSGRGGVQPHQYKEVAPRRPPRRGACTVSGRRRRSRSLRLRSSAVTLYGRIQRRLKQTMTAEGLALPNLLCVRVTMRKRKHQHLHHGPTEEAGNDVDGSVCTASSERACFNARCRASVTNVVMSRASPRSSARLRMSSSSACRDAETRTLMTLIFDFDFGCKMLILSLSINLK